MIASVPAYRMLRSALGMQLGQFVRQLATVMTPIADDPTDSWTRLAEAVAVSSERSTQMLDVLSEGELQSEYRRMADRLIDENPHAVYPTSPYRASHGKVIDNGDCTQVEAVMSSQTYTSIRISEGVLEPDDTQ